MCILSIQDEESGLIVTLVVVYQLDLFTWPKQPLTQKVIVGHPKLWRNANSLGARATLSSLRARRTSKTVVKCKFFRRRRNLFVTSWWSDVRNYGKTMIFVCRGRLPTPCACFIQFRARRCSETYILTFCLGIAPRIGLMKGLVSVTARWIMIRLMVATVAMTVAVPLVVEREQ